MNSFSNNINTISPAFTAIKNSNQARIAIPSKGRLKEKVLAFLSSKGYPVKKPSGRVLQTIIEGKEHLQVVYLHAKDIVKMLDEGIVDIGFTGLDLISETNVSIRPVVKLGECKVKLCLLVPESMPYYHPFHLLDKTIATPFPNIAQDYFNKLKIRVNIRPILGASEGMPNLGIADGIVDVVETGSSAKENSLKIIADDLFDSECVCAVKKPEFQPNYSIINAFLRDIYE
jgi:ATP phosphoribosyltransferase